MTRRAVALLIVLLVLVVAVSAAAATAHLSVAARSHHEASARRRLAGTLLRGSDDLIGLFLRTDSRRVVLPPEAAEPGVVIVDDHVDLIGTRCRVFITAYDQCGMVPRGMARPGSPLRAALPASVAQAWDRAWPPDAARPVGLDDFTAPSGAADPPAFPAADGRIALGSRIATHNPDPVAAASPASADAGLINVNTAPRALLERALRATGTSGIETIAAARARGQPAAAPPSAAPHSSNEAHAEFRLVSESDCWAFRIDIHVGSIHQSWWSVWRAAGSEWRCVQRVLVDE